MSRSRHCAPNESASNAVQRRLLEAIQPQVKQNTGNTFVAALLAMTTVLFSNWYSARKKAGLARARLEVLAT
jgi:hypothetical protein